MSRTGLLFSTVILAASCGVASSNAIGGDPDAGSGSDSGSGSGSDDAGGSPNDDDGADTPPTYPVQHPPIYVETNRARLTAALSASTTAATRFTAVVDNWVNGASIWGFQAWNAALLGQLTGNAKYC